MCFQNRVILISKINFYYYNIVIVTRRIRLHIIQQIILCCIMYRAFKIIQHWITTR